jgi:hypothetical protein
MSIWTHAENNLPWPLALSRDEQRDLEVLYRMLDFQRKRHLKIVHAIWDELRRRNPALTRNDKALRNLRLDQLGLDHRTMATVAVVLWTFFFKEVDEPHHLLWPGGILEDLFDATHNQRRFSAQLRSS